MWLLITIILFAIIIFKIIFSITTIAMLLVIKHKQLKSESNKESFKHSILKTMKNLSLVGRADRVEFLNYNIFFSIINIVFTILVVILPLLLEKYYYEIDLKIPGIVMTVFMAYCSYILFAVQVRRWQDFGKSYWIYIGIFLFSLLTGLIFFLPIITAVIMSTAPGTSGDNAYGKNPT